MLFRCLFRNNFLRIIHNLNILVVSENVFNLDLHLKFQKAVMFLNLSDYYFFVANIAFYGLLAAYLVVKNHHFEVLITSMHQMVFELIIIIELFPAPKYTLDFLHGWMRMYQILLESILF